MLALLALLTASCGQEPNPQRVWPEPRLALWKVADADTTLYLFGSIHLLPKSLEWRTPLVNQAWRDAGTLFLEADVEGDPTVFSELVNRLGRLDPAQRLSDHLPPELADTLVSRAAALGLPLGSVEGLKPWLAAVTIADAAIRGSGFSADAGVEATLRREARAAGKDTRFLETVERQLSALATLPEQTQIEYLRYTLADVDNAKASLEQMVEAWLSGDLETLDRLLIQDDMARLPALHDALLTHRNAEWARTFNSLLDTERGVFFIAVGAAHLVGEDSVQTQLSRLGRTPERVH